MSNALSPSLLPAPHGQSSVADALGTSPVTPAAPKSTRRQDALLLATASVLALWLGVAAPSVSPVTPPAATPVAVAAAAAPAGRPAPFGTHGGRR
jgi:hypothetical protein